MLVGVRVLCLSDVLQAALEELESENAGVYLCVFVCVCALPLKVLLAVHSMCLRVRVCVCALPLKIHACQRPCHTHTHTYLLVRRFEGGVERV